MALHAQMRAKGEHLVGAMRVGKQSGGAVRNAEGFPVPLKDRAGLASLITHPVAGNGVVGAAGGAPAYLLDGIPGDLAAERLAHQLPAQAMPNDRHIPGYRIANQRADGVDPGQRIIDAHRAAHEAEARKPFACGRHGGTFVDGDQLPRNPLLLKEYGKIARTFGRGVTKDGDWFHVGGNA